MSSTPSLLNERLSMNEVFHHLNHILGNTSSINLMEASTSMLLNTDKVDVSSSSSSSTSF